MIDGADEFLVVVRQEDRRARKGHCCCECGRTIALAETYRYEAGVLGGYFEQYRTCRHCMVAREWLIRECSGWCYEGVLLDLEEHWDESPWLRTLTLGRLIIGMRRRWRSDGTGRLMPVPELPAAKVASA